MNNWVYILIGISVTFVIRVLPVVLIKEPIENKFIKSFLYYVPYVTLSLMTFPAMIQGDFIPGLCALIIGIAAAYKGFDLLTVAIICCVIYFLVAMIF